MGGSKSKYSQPIQQKLQTRHPEASIEYSFVATDVDKKQVVSFLTTSCHILSQQQIDEIGQRIMDTKRETTYDNKIVLTPNFASLTIIHITSNKTETYIKISAKISQANMSMKAVSHINRYKRGHLVDWTTIKRNLTASEIKLVGDRLLDSISEMDPLFEDLQNKFKNLKSITQMETQRVSNLQSLIKALSK
jgi:hypothetical protein